MRTHLSIHYFSNSISNGSCKIQKNKKNSIHHKKKKRFHKNNSLATHSRKSPRDHRKGLAPTDTLPRVKRLPNVPSWQPRATVSRTCTVIARSCRRDSQAWKLDEKRLEMKSVFFPFSFLKTSSALLIKRNGIRYDGTSRGLKTKTYSRPRQFQLTADPRKTNILQRQKRNATNGALSIRIQSSSECSSLKPT